MGKKGAENFADTDGGRGAPRRGLHPDRAHGRGGDDRHPVGGSPTPTWGEDRRANEARDFASEVGPRPADRPLARGGRAPLDARLHLSRPGRAARLGGGRRSPTTPATAPTASDTPYSVLLTRPGTDVLDVLTTTTPAPTVQVLSTTTPVQIDFNSQGQMQIRGTGAHDLRLHLRTEHRPCPWASPTATSASTCGRLTGHIGVRNRLGLTMTRMPRRRAGRLHPDRGPHRRAGGDDGAAGDGGGPAGGPQRRPQRQRRPGGHAPGHHDASSSSTPGAPSSTLSSICWTRWPPATGRRPVFLDAQGRSAAAPLWHQPLARCGPGSPTLALTRPYNISVEVVYALDSGIGQDPATRRRAEKDLVKRRARRRRQSGLTIVELLITIVVASILSVATFTFFAGQQRIYDVQTELLNMQQNLWAAHGDARPLRPGRGGRHGRLRARRPARRRRRRPPPRRRRHARHWPAHVAQPRLLPRPPALDPERRRRRARHDHHRLRRGGLGRLHRRRPGHNIPPASPPPPSSPPWGRAPPSWPTSSPCWSTRTPPALRPGLHVVPDHRHRRPPPTPCSTTAPPRPGTRWPTSRPMVPNTYTGNPTWPPAACAGSGR